MGGFRWFSEQIPILCEVLTDFIHTTFIFSACTAHDGYSMCTPGPDGAFEWFSHCVLHLTAFSLDTELPDYDLNSEDETFVNKLKKKMEITALQFEEMIDRLEKGSGKQVFAPAYTHLYCLYGGKEAKQVIFILMGGGVISFLHSSLVSRRPSCS